MEVAMKAVPNFDALPEEAERLRHEALA